MNLDDSFAYRFSINKPYKEIINNLKLSKHIFEANLYFNEKNFQTEYKEPKKPKKKKSKKIFNNRKRRHSNKKRKNKSKSISKTININLGNSNNSIDTKKINKNHNKESVCQEVR